MAEVDAGGLEPEGKDGASMTENSGKAALELEARKRRRQETSGARQT
jgi:hypothetical protein